MRTTSIPAPPANCQTLRREIEFHAGIDPAAQADAQRKFDAPCSSGGTTTATAPPAPTTPPSSTGPPATGNDAPIGSAPTVTPLPAVDCGTNLVSRTVDVPFTDANGDAVRPMITLTAGQPYLQADTFSIAGNGGSGTMTLEVCAEPGTSGLPLESGLVEIVTEESSRQGERHAELSDHIGEITVRGWLGQPDEPSATTAGVGWVLATEWVPYQQPTFVTPAFPGYVSGHSTFSRAGAEVLAGFTGDPFFPGGMATHVVEPGELGHELGPSETVVLQWASYADAADEAGLSRLYGGIHVPVDDLAGREIGARIGRQALEHALESFG